MSDRIDPDRRTTVPTTGDNTRDNRVDDTTRVTTDGTTSRVVVHDVPSREPSLGELFVELSNDLSYLVRQEVALAKTEVRENLDRGRQGVILMAAGGVAAIAGLLVLLACIVIVLGNALDSYWLSALIVGAVLAVIGLVLIFSGKGRLDKMNLIPEKTIDSLEKDAKMAKEKLT